MSTHDDQRREHPSTYFVQDRSNEDELTRLQVQDQMVTAGMGGVLSEQPDLTIFRRVVDIGCGTGGWLIAVAKSYPSMSELVGVDVSSRMLEYARTQAEAENVGDRVQFRTMDALRMLEFPADYFDLINQRFCAGFLRTWEWSKLLQEYGRIARPGGVIRITEADYIGENTSPALSRLYDIALQAFYKSGNYATPNGDAVISQLPQLLTQHGFQHVQTQPHTLAFRTGTPEGARFYEETRLVYRTMAPFLRKWTRVPEEYEEIYQQALEEIQQPGFVATWKLLTAWANKPE